MIKELFPDAFSSSKESGDIEGSEINMKNIQQNMAQQVQGNAGFGEVG